MKRIHIFAETHATEARMTILVGSLLVLMYFKLKILGSESSFFSHPFHLLLPTYCLVAIEIQYHTAFRDLREQLTHTGQFSNYPLIVYTH